MTKQEIAEMITKYKNPIALAVGVSIGTSFVYDKRKAGYKWYPAFMVTGVC